MSDLFRKPLNFHTSLFMGGGYFVEIITTPVEGGKADQMFILLDGNNPNSDMVVLEGCDSIDNARMTALDHLKRQRGLNRLLGEIEAMPDPEPQNDEKRQGWMKGWKK